MIAARAPEPRRRRPRRARVTLTLLAAVLTAAGCDRSATSSAPATAARRDWNVLLVTFDTTRADRLGCYGNSAARTPAIDLLAQNGVRYENCFAPATITLPSHATILTGLYPFHHGLRTNGVGPLEDRFETLAEVLRRTGLATGAFLGAAVLEAQYGLAQGFDVYDCAFDPAREGSKFEYPERKAEAVTDAAIAWLEKLGGRRYFLWAHYYDPHAPYAPPGFDAGASTQHAYEAEITYADEHLNRLLGFAGKLRHDTGRDTLVIFCADHGEALWDHGEPTHGLFVYNECLRAPLIIHRPDRPDARGVVHAPVSLADIYPSVLEWLGIAAPYAVHGRALPILPDEPGVDSDRSVYFEAYLAYYTYGWSPLEGVLSHRLKYIQAPRPELYDLRDDPAESRNLYDDRDARLPSLRESLQAVQRAALGHAPADEAEPVQDDESLRKLIALGYAGGVIPSADDDAARADPKDRLPLHRNIIQAQAEIDLGRFAVALELVQNVVRDDPDNPRALFLLGDLLAEPDVQEPADAVARERIAAPLPEPFDALLPLYRGIALARRGLLDDAEEMLKRSLAANPDNSESVYNLSQVYAARGDWTHAEAALRDALRVSPAHAQSAAALGQILERADRLADAVALYEAAITAGADDPILHNNTAWALYRLGQRLDQAETHARRAVEQLRHEARVHHTLGAVLVATGRAADAAVTLEEAVRLAPDYAAAYYQLGLARDALAETDAARSAFRRAIELAGEPPPQWLDDARTRAGEAKP